MLVFISVGPVNWLLWCLQRSASALRSLRSVLTAAGFTRTDAICDGEFSISEDEGRAIGSSEQPASKASNEIAKHARISF